MQPRRSRDYENVGRPVVGVGHDFSESLETAEHVHRRGQFLYAASGVLAVRTPVGAWVVPPERAVWIPRGIAHSVRIVGAVQARGVLIDTAVCAALPGACQVVGVSALLRQLLVAAASVPAEYDETGRDGALMQLLVAEIGAAPPIPLAVPFPRHAALAALCQAFLERPRAAAPIADWAAALAMSRRSFTRLFRGETGMSMAAWRQQACVAVALPRLAAGEAVTTLALDLGYDTPANFSTMFKRVLGVPPSHFGAADGRMASPRSFRD